jgi:hypothetical protein
MQKAEETVGCMCGTGQEGIRYEVESHSDQREGRQVMRFRSSPRVHHDAFLNAVLIKAHRWRVLPIATVLAVFGVGASPAMATVGWSVQSIADPTHFSPEDAGLCDSEGVCDRYQLVIRNDGDTASTGPVTMIDKLPRPAAGGAAPAGQEPAFAEFGGVGWECSSAVVSGVTVVTCTTTGSVPAEGYARPVAIPVVAPSTATGLPLRNEVTVTGGGATAVGEGSAVEETASASTEPPVFGLAAFSFGVTNVGGGASMQAGGHPGDVTASFDLSDILRPLEEASQYAAAIQPVENARAAVVELPAGFIGDPLATPTCSEHDLLAEEEGRRCPLAARVGVAMIDLEGRLHFTGGPVGESESFIYNVAPESGYPAEFAFAVDGKMVSLYASLVHTSSGYRVRVTAPGIPAVLGPVGASLTFFGDPAQVDGTGGQHVAFLTNPTDCSAGPLTARMEVDSWENPARWVSAESTVYPQVTGCNLLQFDPTFEMAPSSPLEGGTTQADEPSGYNVDLKVPQTSLFEEAATPELKGATVTLPEGVSASPSLADGLVGCPEAGPEGIDLPEGGHPGHEAGKGEAIGVDALPHLTPGHCPAKSQIATVKITTPLLASPLTGHVYLAQPKCGGEGQHACEEADATNGNLISLYLEAEGAGQVVKLKGTVAADPHTGRLTATFRENPQIPFSELKLHFTSGPRAPIANPQTCGSFATTTDLSSWASPEVADVAGPSPSFTVDWDGQGGACPGSLPFGPSFSAGTITPTAGGFSPFTLTFSRHDREQDLSGITVQTPPGLLGTLSQVSLCPEPQASLGACGAGSLIGHTTVGAGPGSHPFFVGGSVFLTGPYKGAPFGLSVVVPAVAGPFNLGDVIVRAAIYVDPHTGSLTVVSNPLPQIIDGVPLRVQTVNVTIDRPGFMFNPTSCVQQQIAATITGALPNGAPGSSVGVSSPFAAAGCANLPFSPKFTASTQGATSKANGASLTVKVQQAPGEANIHKADLQLPKALPARLTTLQKACTEAQFNANPAGCPAASDIGTATAVTPVLNVPLTGPAYLVSHGGAAFPDVVFVLQGQGVTIDLDGATDIKKGITYSKFETVPDAPISSFETVLPEGPHSVLASPSGSLCGQSLTIPMTITGQNGKQITQSTKIAVTGCAKPAVKIKKAKLEGDTVLLAITTTQQGTVTISGGGLKKTSKTLAAGAHQVKIPLSNAGRITRRRHGKATLKVVLKGSDGSASRTTTLKL